MRYGLCTECLKKGMYEIKIKKGMYPPKSSAHPAYTVLKCRYCGSKATYSS